MKAGFGLCTLALGALTLTACEQYQRDRIAENVDAAGAEETEFSDPEPAQLGFGIDARAVRIGMDGPQMDACGAYGEIAGLNPDGDNFLSVRAAPDTQAEELDRLSSGTGIYLCDREEGWIGIVYEASGAGGAACGVSSPVSGSSGGASEYRGPCRSGWVSERFVNVIAG